jgi:uncharacterized delta-60 repeat protein
VRVIAVQGDGKILVGLAVNAWIVRLNADGTADTAFNSTSAAALIGEVDCIAVQSDGKIVVGGQIVGGCARLKTDGSPDTTFSTDIAPARVLTLAVQSDGKIVVGGAFASVKGVSRVNIARLNADGTLDTGFLANGSGAYDYTGSATGGRIYSLAVQADGNIVIGGDFTYYGGGARGRIARIKADGSLE